MIRFEESEHEPANTQFDGSQIIQCPSTQRVERFLITVRVLPFADDGAKFGNSALTIFPVTHYNLSLSLVFTSK